MTRLRTNALAMVGAFLSQAIFVFLQMKILTRWMPQTEFGLFSAVFAFGAILAAIVELGWPLVLIRFGAKFDAEGRPRALRRLLLIGIALFLVAWGIMALLLHFGVRHHLLPGLRYAGMPPGLPLLGFAAVASFGLRAMIFSVYQGSRRMLPVLVLDVVYGVAVTGLYLVYRESLDAPRVFACLLASSLAVTVAGLTAFLLTAPRASGPAGADDPDAPGRLLAEIQGFWGGSFLTGIVAIGLENADRLAVAAVAPLTSVAVYHVAGRISLFARKILFIPQQVAHPELTYKWERGEVDGIRADLGLFARLEWVLGVLVGGVVVLGARVGVGLASNEEYLGAVAPLTALAGALPILCLQAPLTTFLRASGHIWVSVLSEVVWLLGYIAAGLCLYPLFGLAGFAGGQIVAAALALLYTVASLKRRGLPAPSWLFLAGHGLLALLLWLAAVLLVDRFPIVTLPALLGAAFVFALLLNVGLAWSGYFSARDEARLLGFLGGGPWARVGHWFLTWPRGGTSAHG